jgi:hypothetical protein
LCQFAKAATGNVNRFGGLLSMEHFVGIDTFFEVEITNFRSLFKHVVRESSPSTG